jgi:hypothetical protein
VVDYRSSEELIEESDEDEDLGGYLLAAEIGLFSPYTAKTRRTPFYSPIGRKHTSDFGSKKIRRPHGVHEGAAKQNPQKNSQRTCVLYLGKIELLYTCDDVLFLIAFLSSPHRETPTNAQNKTGKGEKNWTHDPVKLFYHVFEFPSPRGA